MYRTAVVLLVAVGSLVAQGPPSRFGQGFGAAGVRGPVTGAPFSATQVTLTQQSLAGGNMIERQEQTSISRDSQGRMRSESSVRRPDGSTVTRITVTDSVADVRRMIDTQNRTVEEVALRPITNRFQGHSRPGRSQPADEPNVVSESLGTQTVNGVQADGTRRTRTIPAGAIGNVSAIQIVQETWFSPDLHVPVLVKVTDPRFGVTVHQLTNINRTEPDAALFQTPAGYSVLQAGPRKGPR
jgi:hypothetical protein